MTVSRRRSNVAFLRKVITQIVSYAVIVLVSALFLIPWIWLVSTSLKPPSQIIEIPPRLIPNPFMWINYYYGVTYINFFQYLLNTLIICVVVIVGRLFSCTVVAYSLSHINWVGKGILFAIVLATMMLPQQVTMIPVFIIFTRLGWINTFLPLTAPAFFGDAFFIFMMRQFFMTIPKDLIDSARLDGASHLGIYMRIVMPLAKPAIATLLAFTFIWTFTDFAGPLIYLKNRDLWTLSLGMQGYLQRYGAGGGTALGAMMAAATLYTLPMIVLFFVAQKTFIQGVITTGFK
ncbi:MAG: carbohydrate ABC transporter permease [Chloroflexi bacterium]|nr:carbohydrate ABC transporter permease [Chloroflexota bacterium]